MKTLEYDDSRHGAAHEEVVHPDAGYLIMALPR